MTGSNRRHPPCKGGALPAELIARNLRWFARSSTDRASCAANLHRPPADGPLGGPDGLYFYAKGHNQLRIL
jgi:hypothetical protein